MSVHQLARPVERPGATPPWAKFLSAAITPEWRPGEWDDATSVFTGSIGQPLSLVSQCLTPECRTLVDSPQARCIRCRRARSASTSKHEFEQEYCPPAPKPRGARQLGIHQFSLAGLQPSVRDEVLYGLQQRDLQATGVRPSTVSRLVNRIGPAVQSILDVDLPDLVAVQAGMLRSLQLHVRRLRSLHVGDDGTRGEIWDAALVGLRSAPNRPYIAAFGRLDFTPIRQEWLRRVVMELARAHRPSAQEVHRDIAVATLASAALTGRPHGNDPTGLGRADMAAVFAAINASRSPRTGRVYSVTHRISNLGRWQRLMSTARTSGLMDDVPGTFALGPGDHIAPEQITEEQLGRAVPDSWIRHLDDHLSLLGSSTAFAWGEWSATDFALMYQTIYQLIRDTGRRPNEIVSLAAHPVESRAGLPVLVYDNHKARRLGRRLPIDQATASIVQRWIEHRATLPLAQECRQWLFPAPGMRGRTRRAHMSPNLFGKHFVAWLQLVPPPTAGHGDDAPAGAVFGKIQPYGFRHAYAQRHADSGTPVDVLRELMDHREVDTTMGYYQVSLIRKQEAVRLVSQFAVDRHGRPAPFTDAISYERSSVAVPYGNCTEPSNVKAGGSSCPIRFQCAGCGFFRPDPSYLTAIDHHVTELRADRAIAEAADTAAWVVTNLDDQITAFAGVADTMRQHLLELPDQERGAVEASCQDLRKARSSNVIAVDTLFQRTR